MKTCPKCGNTKVVAIEYAYGSSERYDGVSEYYCPPSESKTVKVGCGYRQGRWTGQELKKGEIESRYGERGVVKVKDEQ